MKYKHLSEIPENIRQPYIRETAKQIIKDKLLKEINYKRLLRSVK